MNGRRLGLLILIVWALLAPAAAAQPADEPLVVNLPQPPSEPAYAPGRLLVKLEPGATLSVASDVRAQFDATLVQRSAATGAELWQVPAGRELEIAEALLARSDVAYAHPDWIVYALGPDLDDPAYALFQWNLPIINAPAAWDITTGGPVIIAVLDTGVALTHPDLQSELVSGYDFHNNDSNPSDDHGHGTHVAGIAAAATNNGIGIAGVSWGARIMPVKVLGATGQGSLSTVATGIEWAVDQGAQVLNMSLGASYNPARPQDYEYLQDALDYAHAQGAVSVAAMGNCFAGQSCSVTDLMAPAAMNHVIAVAATGPTDVRAAYSMVGDHCDLAAPGGDDSGGNVGDRVYSTYPSSNYAWMQGTSMATPHVAGAAALLFTVAPDLSPDMVRVLLQAAAVDKGALGRDPYYGSGRIDIAEALGKAELLIAPNDPRVDEQWALALANVPEAWAEEDALPIGATDVVTVAVLSTGVDATHPELGGRLLPGYDARPDADNPVDTIGRGTALAGIIAANSDNGAGIAGMARAASVRVLPIRVTADSGAVRTDALIAGIAYASAQRAQIILIDGSGTISYHQDIENALANAHAQGALIVAGTGDSGAATVGYPASSPHVLAISATTWDDTLAPTSRYGTGVALAAPGGTTAGQTSGVLVLNTGGGYTTRASTAVAAAHVAGTAAMMLARQPAARPDMLLTTARLRMLLQAGARDLGAQGHDASYGAGRLDVERSLWLATHIEPQLVLPLVARNW